MNSIHTLEEAQALGDTLMDPSCYPHEVDDVEIVETFNSIVALTGERAYKIKKPLDLDDVDYSTLERRFHFCHEEVRLTRRFAPHLNMRVIPVTGTPDEPRLNGSGTPFEYAIQMCQFPRDKCLDHILRSDERTGLEIDQLGRSVATFHNRIESAHPGTEYGHSNQIRKQFQQHLETVRSSMDDRTKLVSSVSSWLEQRHNQLGDRFSERRKRGFVRECHGDLHIKNITRIDGSFLLFDFADYDERLRWIDTMREIALLFIDFLRWRRPDLAWEFLNEYLDWTGDYDGLDVFRFYTVFRGLEREALLTVRKKYMEQHNKQYLDEAGYRAGKFLETVEPITELPSPQLIILHGLPGSGKSTFVRRLIKRYGGIHLTADIERKRLHGMDPLDRSKRERDAELLQGVYSPASAERTYTRLRNLSEHILKAGYRVFVDATFLKRHHRDKMRHVSNVLDVPFRILKVWVREEELIERVRSREEGEEESVSEADLSVLAHERESMEPLEEDEQQDVLSINLERPFTERCEKLEATGMFEK